MDDNAVRHIAELSRLKLSQDQMHQFSKELSSILAYVSELNEVDTKNVEPTGHAVALRNVFRDDAGARAGDEEAASALVRSAPDQEDGWVKVKAVL